MNKVQEYIHIHFKFDVAKLDFLNEATKETSTNIADTDTLLTR